MSAKAVTTCNCSELGKERKKLMPMVMMELRKKFLYRRG
jgi:hypothetical protein